MFCCRDFNFSGEYRFKYDQRRGELNCEQNNHYPSEFYKSENVELISYIIGDNGAGKTTLLSLLMEIIPCECGSEYTHRGGNNFIYILKDDIEDSIYYYTTLDKIKVTPQDLNIKRITNSVNCSRSNMMKSTAVVFYSDILDRDRYNVQYDLCGVEDLSFNGLLKRDSEHSMAGTRRNEKSELRDFLDADMIRQINFISDNYQEDLKQWIPFRLPNRLDVFFTEDEKVLKSAYRYVPDYKDDEYTETEEQSYRGLESLRKILAKRCYKILEKYDSYFKGWEDEFTYKIKRGILMSAMEYVFPDSVGNGTSKEFEKDISDFEDFLNECDYDSSEEFVLKFLEKVQLGHEDLIEAMKKLDNLKTGDEIKSLRGKGYIDLTSGKDLMVDFYKAFRKTALDPDYVTFRWSGLSSGEYAMLTLYSRIYSVKKKLKNQEAIILLMDEAALSYHPRWQQDYINSLVHFLNKFYQDKHIQIIIATHSPVMLSDALKENVIFLEKSDETLDNTFGANIYDLYRKGMFLTKSPFGIIGTYAENKLEEIIKKLEDWEEEQGCLSKKELKTVEEMRKMIDCIGDPVIKRIISRRLDQVADKIKVYGENRQKKDVSTVIDQLNRLSPEELEMVMEAVRKK